MLSTVRRHPAVKKVRRHVALLRQTGRLHPDHIALAASGHTIYVDRDDPRGWGIIWGLGRGHQPALIDLWMRAVTAAQPDLVIDVGANYGEMLLSPRYGREARVLAIEANPKVAAILSRSISLHPDADRIELHEVLASDTDGGTAVLRIDPQWSGSAGVTLKGTGLIEVEVPVRRIDAITAGVDPGVKLLLKIDAEGWEGPVLTGLRGLTDRAASVVALIEFDPSHLERAGFDPASVFAQIAALGACSAVNHQGQMTPVATAPTETCDLLAVSDPAVALALTRS